MFLSKARMNEIDMIIDNMFMKTGMSYPENTIGELLDRLGIQYSMNAELPEGISGIIFLNKKYPYIAVNGSNTKNRKVFSLAHELGHYMLGHVMGGHLSGSIKYRVDTYDYSQDEKGALEETEANYFAASLLVPENKLRWILTQTLDIGMIAHAFGVSEAVIRNRMKWVGII